MSTHHVQGRKVILLGVTASIAAHRALDLIRLLKTADYDVRVVATENALHFFPKETAEVFSGNTVETSAYGLGPRVSHVEWGQEASAILIAPASADFIAKMALGLADDLLSTLCLASSSKILFAPAMEERMYKHPATQEHISTLKNWDIREIPPETGSLASGKSGVGRMASVESIFSALQEVLSNETGITKDLLGKTVLISAGPTYEPIDPVRFIGNRSSGKMGYALAEASIRRGANVQLISGPVALPPPQGANVVYVETAREMQEMLFRHFPSADILIMAAAVSDYTTESTLAQKKKKDGTGWTLHMKENPDILQSLSKSRHPGQTIMGFAAETSLVKKELQDKLQRKGVDLLAANNISEPGSGFGSENNTILLLTHGGSLFEFEEKRGSKKDLADWLIDRIILLRNRSLSD
ncbi:MAG: bifunctional phosphopantothenoylcysteine decarboxylase/phosphopantothenate--cysteine ligase CoaBC [Leptospirillum sp.]